MSADDNADTSTSAIDVPSHATSRDDIEKIVHAYIVENPDVIVEALRELDRRDQEAQAERAKIAYSSMLDDERDFTLGPDDAPVTIVEFFDYQCGYCKRSVDWLMNKVDEHEGQVRVVFKEYPVLRDPSDFAAKAAIASIEQGKYLEFHQTLMKKSNLTEEIILATADEVGMDVDQLKETMASEETEKHLADNLAIGREGGIDGTPGFFINGEQIVGFNQPLLESVLKEQLEG
tara:strand:- start:12605 stop:13303 length:699 start_codon:yes stop_codon:yes gene_type:complete